jgi:hypothetical protein
VILGHTDTSVSARGTSTIMNAHQVDRGYERLGARITPRAGKGRLPAGLPAGTKVAHETGTFSR